MQGRGQPRAEGDSWQHETVQKANGALQDCEFRVNMERHEHDTIGINLDVTDGVSLIVVDILQGAVLKWNEANREEMHLQMHDRILEANGTRGCADGMLSVLKQNTTWELVVQRPREFRVVINRTDALALGVDLRYAPNGKTLMISEISDGPIKEWNASSPTWQVKELDRIIELNGVRGSSQDLLSAGLDKDTLEMSILSYGAAQ